MKEVWSSIISKANVEWQIKKKSILIKDKQIDSS
jgi:hypothetical protein